MSQNHLHTQSVIARKEAISNEIGSGELAWLTPVNAEIASYLAMTGGEYFSEFISTLS
jgi:hypothetical protein